MNSTAATTKPSAVKWNGSTATRPFVAFVSDTKLTASVVHDGGVWERNCEPTPRYAEQRGGVEAMSATSSAYLEIINFIAAGTTPLAVANYRPSAEARRRVSELIDREKAGGLTADESSEPDHFVELEHILRMVKARARQILSREG